MTRIRLENVSKRYSPDAGPNPEGLGALVGQALIAPGNRRYFDEMHQRQSSAAPGGVPVDRLSLDVVSGETLSIVGPSGCGKTTLLKVVAGLQEPDAGRVYFDDQDVTGQDASARGIGMVFQSYALYPHMRSRDNVGFFFRLHRREEEIPDRVRAVSEMMGIDFRQLLDRKPPKLSGGQQQRVAIARCIAREPRAFLFDEPLSHLDAKLRMHMRAELKRLLHRFDITSLYVTHDQMEAIALGDRIAVMRAGRIEQVGTYAEIHDTPANSFVAGFIGLPPMNLWPAQVEAGIVRVGSLRLPLPAYLAQRPADGPAVFGVRPEHLELTPDGPLSMDVEWVEPLITDHATLLHGTVEGLPAVARLAGAPGLHAGQRVALTFEPALAHLFGATSEERWT